MDKHSASDNGWIGKYYERTTSERRASFDRRDHVTRWTYMVFGVFVGAYAVLLSDDNGSFLRFVLTATTLAIMTRFFFQSAIAYGFFIRHRHIQTEIERYWMGNSDIERVKSVIREFDHGRCIPTTTRKVVAGQLRSGALGLALPLFLLNDFVGGAEYYGVLVLLVVYVSYEIVNYARYDQMTTSV